MGVEATFELEILSTGDEIVQGQLVDTNSCWIARQSTVVGAGVRRLTCVGDSVGGLAKALERALTDGWDMVVITGGLGPSHDDLTVEGIAEALGRKVVYDDEALKMLKAKCEKASIQLTEHRKRMARSVDGAEALENRVGLAPGLLIREGATIITALPGIPREMKTMFKRFVLPLISTHSYKRSAAVRMYVSLPYYKALRILANVRGIFPTAYIKTHSKPPSQGRYDGMIEGLRVDLLVWGNREEECEARLDEIISRTIQLVEKGGGRATVERVKEVA